MSSRRNGERRVERQRFCRKNLAAIVIVLLWCDVTGVGAQSSPLTIQPSTSRVGVVTDCKVNEANRGLQIILFERDQGPICYTAEIFYEGSRVNTALPGTLLASGLFWFWESARIAEIAKEYAHAGVPPERSFTKLTVLNSAEFRNDLLERNIDGYGRFIALFGIDTDSSNVFSDDGSFRFALEQFLVSASSPIQVVVVQVGDSLEEHVFVPRSPAIEVQSLLKYWKIEPANINDIRPYPKLYTASLESLYKIQT